MPFVQMENISHFLSACEMPPLSLPSHDRFLTVDLYDSKDPAQVLQCIAAFSRRANAVNPSVFPTTIGAKSKDSAMSPQGTGSSAGTRSPAYTNSTRPRGTSNTSDGHATTFNPLNKAAYSGRISPTKTVLGRGGLASPGPVSSWSNRADENITAPAWNIHQYGYMGGASQGNQGVAFGARRQITAPAPQVPSLAEKEKRLKEQEERKRVEAEELEKQQRAEREADEERARREEERRWEEETRKLREKEEQERRWEEETRKLKEKEEQERRWREEEQQQQRRAREAAARKDRDREAEMAEQRSRPRTFSDARLNGQFLSQYQAEQARTANPSQAIRAQPTPESKRIQELERQLDELKHQQAGQQTSAAPSPAPPARSESPPPPALPSRPNALPTSHEDDWDAAERDYLRKEWQNHQLVEERLPPKPPRPTPSEPARPLPDPSTYVPGSNRTDRFLASHPAPTPVQPVSYRPADYSTTTEVDLENQRRAASQAKTKAGGWASKSLLEREMERERERQREWEESQKATAAAARDWQEGSAPGHSWDVHQYGYMGGDSQNRGGPGLGVGGARRQIIGPRPPP